MPNHRRLPHRTVSLVALTLAAPAFAAADGDATIVVLAPEYAEGRISSATKTDTPLRDVPQAISVVTRDLIDDASLRSIGDVVRYVPGVSIGQGEGHRDQATLRGNNTTADFFVDGVRDDVQYFRGLYNIDRVEVLKGPNAMIFGRGGGGGVINRVSKTPQDTAFNTFALSADTYGSAYIEADVNAPVSDNFALRLNGTYERLDNHRDAFSGDRHAVNPTARFDLGAATSITTSYEYVNDDRLVDRGVPSQAGRPLRGFRDTFFGIESVNNGTFDAHVFKLTTEHRFSDALKITNKLSYGDYDKLYQNVFAATPVQANGTVGISAYRNGTQRKNAFNQTDLVLTAATGGINHTLLAGFEIGNQASRSQHSNGLFDPPGGAPTGPRTIFVPLSDPVIIPPVTFRADSGSRSTRSDANVAAAYVQDQISLGDHFDVLAGIRYDRFTLKVDDLLKAASFKRCDGLWSPRLGLIYNPIEPVSIYASYSRSFLPQSGDQFSSLDLTLEALKPEKFDNYEIGFKWDIREALSLTTAIYRLDRSNTRAAGPIAGTTVLTGAQRSKGIEVSLTGKITPEWRISAGYALQDAEIQRTTTAAPAGRGIAMVPKHQVSLWNQYSLSDRIGFGVGVYHQSKSFTSISNLVTLPAFTRVDAALFVKLNDNVEAQLNAENALNDGYFPTAHNDNNISTGGPRSARLTLRTRF